MATTLLCFAAAGRVNPLKGPIGSGCGGAHLPGETVMCNVGALRVAASAGSGGPGGQFRSVLWHDEQALDGARAVGAVESLPAMAHYRRVGEIGVQRAGEVASGVWHQDAAGPSDAVGYADAEGGDSGSSIERLRR